MQHHVHHHQQQYAGQHQQQQQQQQLPVQTAPRGLAPMSQEGHAAAEFTHCECEREVQNMVIC